MIIAPIMAGMKVNISVSVDSHFTIRYDASLFNSRIVRQAGNEMDIELDRNRLSEMIEPAMKCLIEVVENARQLKGSIVATAGAGDNGTLTLKCRV